MASQRLAGWQLQNHHDRHHQPRRGQPQRDPQVWQYGLSRFHGRDTKSWPKINMLKGNHCENKVQKSDIQRKFSMAKMI